MLGQWLELLPFSKKVTEFPPGLEPLLGEVCMISLYTYGFFLVTPGIFSQAKNMLMRLIGSSILYVCVICCLSLCPYVPRFLHSDYWR